MPVNHCSLRVATLASMMALASACTDDPSQSGVGGGSAGGPTVGPGGPGSGTGGGPGTGGGTGSGEPAEDAAEVVSSTLPGSMACGEVLEATIAMRNTGTRSWTREDGDKLGGVDDSDPLHPGEARIWLEEGVTVAPGETHSFRVALTAPGEAGSHLTDWQMVRENVGWFGEIAASDVSVTCGPVEDRTGPVTLDGSSLRDDQGRFNALGATMMWAAWAYKFDRAKLEANLDYLASNGFHYIRALGVVGDYDEPDYWDGREIDWRWEDYPEVVAGLTDLAFDTYGLRIEWTLIGDGQLNIPEESDRYALVDTFLEMAGPRAEKIIHFEIANEAWQNGFAGDEGIAQLRALAVYMNERTDILVAASAPPTADCDELAAIYDGGIADIATVHFDRDVGTVEGHWRPVRMPWDHAACNMPVGSNNEPIGPGASVAAEEDPLRLVAGAIVTYLSGLPLHVFHSHAGVRGDEEIFEEAGAGDFVHLAQIVPGDLASWTREDATSPDSPFRVYAQEAGVLYPDTMWTDLAAPENGALRAFGAVRGDDFFVFPIAILDKVVLEPRRAMSFDVIDPLTGAVVASHTLAAGETVEVSGGEALVLRGAFE